MDAQKSWYLSRTIWASIVIVAAAAADALGHPVDAEEEHLVTEALLQAVSAIGGIAAIIGRVAARTRIM